MSASEKLQAIVEHRKKEKEQQEFHKPMIDEIRSLFNFDHLTEESEKYFKVWYNDQLSQIYKEKLGTVISVFTYNCKYKSEVDNDDDPFCCCELPNNFLDYEKAKELNYDYVCQGDYHWVFYKKPNTD